MSLTTDRRSFLFGASVAGFGIFAQGRRGWAAGVGPNETLNIACIGVGGKGRSDTENAAHYGRIVALCDIDRNRLDAMGEKHKDAKKYADYRELLHELESRIDAVVVSTPDHTHAPAAVMAMRLGKHVYCQKPLTHTVWEAALMRETARAKKVCTQMGNQGTARPASAVAPSSSPVSSVTLPRFISGPIGHSSTGNRRPISSPAPRMCPFLLILAGISSSERLPSARITRFIPPTTGAAGGISEPARSATWPATPPTSPSWASSLDCPSAYPPTAARSTRRPIPPGP